jgi:hypothetical protein
MTGPAALYVGRLYAVTVAGEYRDVRTRALGLAACGCDGWCDRCDGSGWCGLVLARDRRALELGDWDPAPGPAGERLAVVWYERRRGDAGRYWHHKVDGATAELLSSGRVRIDAPSSVRCSMAGDYVCEA